MRTIQKIENEMEARTLRNLTKHVILGLISILKRNFRLVLGALVAVAGSVDSTFLRGERDKYCVFAAQDPCSSRGLKNLRSRFFLGEIFSMLHMVTRKVDH